MRGLAFKGLSHLYNLGLHLWYLYDDIRDKYVLPGYTISVGNLTVGGSGKTPLALFIAKKLAVRYRVAILSRGYKRKSKGILFLGPENVKITWKEAGDEPYLLWKKTGGKIPVIVGKNREDAAELAVSLFKTRVFILDDGFQYLRVKKDKEILLFDWKTLRNGDYLLPYGRMREPWSAVDRADIIVINFKNISLDENVVEKVEIWKKPCFFMRYIPVALYNYYGERMNLDVLKDREVAILSGIADPQSFEEMIRKLGAKIVKKLFISDHGSVSIKKLRELHGSMEYVITTEKDLIKYPGFKNLFALEIKPEINREEEFLRLIRPNF